jgi:hypothetical protein
MKMNKYLFYILAIVCGYSYPVIGYEQLTHQDLSERALFLSVLNPISFPNEGVLSNIGLKPVPLDLSQSAGGQEFENSYRNERTIKELVRDGSDFEDYNFHSSYHFYDPLIEEGITILKITSESSPDWALEDPHIIDYTVKEENSNSAVLPQRFSYSDAQEYLYQAIIADTEETRSANFGRFFQSFGHVIHHIQDMAQPEHVRLDAHLTWEGFLKGLEPVDPYDLTLLKALSISALKIIGVILYPVVAPLRDDPSQYEIYTQYVNSGETGKILPLNGYPIPNFPTPRNFWSNPLKQGIAQFTNSNFVSPDTNFELVDGEPIPNIRYYYPVIIDPNQDRLVLISDLYRDAGESIPSQIQEICRSPTASDIFDCEIAFVSTYVQDSLTNEIKENERASSPSLLNQDIKRFGDILYVDEQTEYTWKVDSLFYLNRFNFDAAHKFLIPRAVAYSAGLINHFFRGKLEISELELEAAPDSETYPRVKLKARNTTLPIGSVAQNMSRVNPENGELENGGVLEVVARYRLSGDPEEKLSRSTPLAVNLPAQGEPAEFEFTMKPEIPTEATQVNLYLIYRGALGQEANVIAVSRHEIGDLFKLDISLPEEGVYALVDHAVVNQMDDGFPLLKFRLKITPAQGAAVTEAMNGELKLAAEFYINLCYQPDLSGELTTDTNSWYSWSGCLNDPKNPQNPPQEHRIESLDAKTVIAANHTEANLGISPAFAFSFPASHPIPLAATDLILKLEYTFLHNGKPTTLTFTRDISEPTYWTFDNSTEYFWLEQNFYAFYEMRDNPESYLKWEEYLIDLAYTPVPFSIEVSFNQSGQPILIKSPTRNDNTSIRLGVGKYSRVALLGDVKGRTEFVYTQKYPYLFGDTYRISERAGSVLNRVVNSYRSEFRLGVSSPWRGSYRWLIFYSFWNPLQESIPNIYLSTTLLPEDYLSLTPQPVTIVFPNP